MTDFPHAALDEWKQATPEPKEHAPVKTRVGVYNYRGCVVYHSPPPIASRDCDWTWTHIDYDGPSDDRCGYAANKDDCYNAIDRILDA